MDERAALTQLVKRERVSGLKRLRQNKSRSDASLWPDGSEIMGFVGTGEANNP